MSEPPGRRVRREEPGTLDLGAPADSLVKRPHDAEQVVLALSDGQAVGHGTLALAEDVGHPEAVTDDLDLFEGSIRSGPSGRSVGRQAIGRAGSVDTRLGRETAESETWLTTHTSFFERTATETGSRPTGISRISSGAVGRESE